MTTSGCPRVHAVGHAGAARGRRYARPRLLVSAWLRDVTCRRCLARLLFTARWEVERVTRRIAEVGPADDGAHDRACAPFPRVEIPPKYST